MFGPLKKPDTYSRAEEMAMVSTCVPQQPVGTQVVSTAPVLALSRATPLRVTVPLFTLPRQPPTYTWLALSGASAQTGWRRVPDFMLGSKLVSAPVGSENAASPLRVAVVWPWAESKMPPT